MSEAIHTESPPLRGLPPHVTFHDLIRANKRKSVVLMIGMGLLVIVVGTALVAAGSIYFGGADESVVYGSLALGAAASTVLAGGSALWSFYGGSAAILRISGAKPIDKADDPQFFNIVEEVAIAAGIPLPKVFLIEDTALNAFATGRDPRHAAVAITTGLRSQLTRDELAGVIAHEISHVRHYDIRFAMLMATMVGLIVFACDAFFHILRHHFWYGGGGGRRSRGRRGGSEGGGAAIVMIVVLVVAVVLAILAPTLAMLIRMAVSRQREYLADAGAVELTRYPQGLIGALEKLGRCREPLEVANRATAHLYIVNPLKDAQRGQGHELDSVFRTHPPLHDRIARLRALIGEGAGGPVSDPRAATRGL